jgi:hypothetical protein
VEIFLRSNTNDEKEKERVGEGVTKKSLFLIPIEVKLSKTKNKIYTKFIHSTFIPPFKDFEMQNIY